MKSPKEATLEANTGSNTSEEEHDIFLRGRMPTEVEKRDVTLTEGYSGAVSDASKGNPASSAASGQASAAGKSRAPKKKFVTIKKPSLKAAPRKKAKEDEAPTVKVEAEPAALPVLERPPDDFVFNAYMGGQEHFDEFKLHVIGGSKQGTGINMEGIARMAAANSAAKKYESKVWEEVDIKRMECNLVKDVIGQQMLLTRQRLGPFVNCGFNHCDRRNKGSKSTADPKLVEKRALALMKNKGKIERFKRKLEVAIQGKDVFVIERILNEIYNYADEEVELEHHLRMEIIKAQLCMSAYYKWRTEKREYVSATAKSAFNKFVVGQPKAKLATRKAKPRAGRRRAALRGQNHEDNYKDLYQDDAEEAKAEPESMTKKHLNLKVSDQGGLVDELQLIEDILKENIAIHVKKSELEEQERGSSEEDSDDDSGSGSCG